MYMMQNVSVANARQHLSEILGKVAYGGEAFVITKKGRPMAHLTPIPASKAKAKANKPKSLGDIMQWMPVDDSIAMKAADLRAYLKRTGQTAGINDCLIAATALVNDWVLVTRNIEHFRPMPGLQVEDWYQ